MPSTIKCLLQLNALSNQTPSLNKSPNSRTARFLRGDRVSIQSAISQDRKENDRKSKTPSSQLIWIKVAQTVSQPDLNQLKDGYNRGCQSSIFHRDFFCEYYALADNFRP